MLDCKKAPSKLQEEQPDNISEDHSVLNSVQILLKKVTDLVKITKEMKEKIDGLEGEIILLRNSRNVSQESTPKVKKNSPVKIKNVHNKSEDKLITHEVLNQETQFDEQDLDMDSVNFIEEEDPEEQPKNFKYLKNMFYGSNRN